MAEDTTILYVDLYDNPLTERKGDYTGKVAITGTLRNTDIAGRIIKKRSEYRQETIENILKLADQEKAIGLSEGKTVVDGVGQYQPTVGGAFEGEKAPFNPEIHHLGVAFTMGKDLRERLASVRVETRTASSGIAINSVRDALTGETDGAIASGSNLVISGVNIKIAGDDPSNGVFLTPIAGGEPIAMRAITHNNPSELTVLLPTLEEGEYTLSVTTQFSQSHTLKEPRTYVYPVTLTVGTDEGGGTPGGV